MNKFSSLILRLGLIAAVLSGCAQSIVMPSAESRSDNEVAILKVDKTVINGLSPLLNGLVDLNTGKIILRSESFKDYNQIKIAPGHYDVLLKVYSSGHGPAFPTVRVEAKAGMTYLFASSVVLNGKAVRAEFKETPTMPEPSPEQ